jgi:hypothetical protein
MVSVSLNPKKAKAPPPQQAGEVASEIVVYSTFQTPRLAHRLTLVATGAAHQNPPLEQLACPGVTRSF